MASRDTSSDDPSLDKAKQAVHLIVTRIETKFKTLDKSERFKVNEIIKAGSLGHGTAVPGHYDIDLVVYSEDISPDDVYENGFKKWVDMLKVFMESRNGFNLTAKTPGRNNRSVQFDISYENVSLSVDLLVSPEWGDDPKEFYKFLGRIPKEKRDMFTVCASKWQVKFFKKVKQDIKEYIRKAKAWRNNNWLKDDRDGRPSSYLMSLLVVKAYERAPQKRPTEITRSLKQLVTNFRSMDVYWEGEGYFYKRADYSDLLPSRPRLIDPANPANNVWESGFNGSCMVLVNGSCMVLVRKINTIDLSKPV